MRIENKLNNAIYNSKNKPIFSGANSRVIYEDDYVKIPKKKYQRDKIILYIINSILTIEIARDLYHIFKNHGRPPFP